MKAQTPAQRQQALRQRRLEQGLTEVRGLYAPPAQHKQIKDAARKLLRASAV
jgi:hypothetical protein